jgi:hypothetical protein
MTVAEFGALIRKMRDAQKEYFKHRDRMSLEKSKKLEKEVDAILDNPYFNSNEPMLKQGSLF